MTSRWLLPGLLARAPHPGRCLVHSRSVDTGREMNAIRTGGTGHLLIVTAGDAVQITRETGPDETGQSAVSDRHGGDGE